MRTPVSDGFIVKEERNGHKDRYFERQSTKTSSKKHNLPHLGDTVSDGGYEQWRETVTMRTTTLMQEERGKRRPAGCLLDAQTSKTFQYDPSRQEGVSRTW